MGRRLHPPLDSKIGLWLFLKAVGDHPWATMGLVLSYSGLLDWEVERHYQPLATKLGLVERADVPALKRAPRRFGLTPSGSAAIGRTWSRVSVWDALMRVKTLDAARLLLTEWIGEVGRTIWSVSPFTIPAQAIRPGNHSLRLDGLTCLRPGPEKYLTMAILVDPGGIKLDWLFHQFRGWYALCDGEDFKSNHAVFPTLVVVAANESRKDQLLRLWHQASASRMCRLPLRLTSFDALAHQAAFERPWWNEHDQRTTLWGGLMAASNPSLRPSGPHASWPGVIVHDEPLADPLPQPYVLPKPKAGLLESSNRSNQPKQLSAHSVRLHLVRLQLEVGAQERRLLERFGEYPLVTSTELADVLDLSREAVRPGIKKLEEQGLVCHPVRGEDGYVLTWLGLTFLAAQIGLRPHRYAELLRWPMHYDEAGTPRYSAEAFLVNREHTRFILDFLTGLRRRGAAQRLELVTWDHVQCVHSFPASSAARVQGQRSPQSARVLPDAIGKVRAFGETSTQYVDTDFWLEIDLGTKRGLALKRQLARYYTVGGPRDGLYGRAIRILFIVQNDDEARLQALSRRIRTLDQRYHTQLDVRLTRRDLLEDERRRLDPTRKVWRTPESSEFVHAFNQWELSPKEKG